FQTSPSTAYLKGNIHFVDGSTLSIFQHIRFGDTETLITDYRYHYMSTEKHMVFRYDNAPHHGELDTHPHHKHISNEIRTSNMPDFKDVLDEATGFVIDNMT
ncbi:MAG: toxin-antitoxin system TumE family protein, partial [Thermodesulfobacteriota bacterium]